MLAYVVMKERIAKIREQIAQICKKCGRDPAQITLIGVTKYTDNAKVQAALDAGLTDIAENRVQDAQDKFAQLRIPPGQVTKHLIGHLQTNKAKDAVKIFDMIQSVDSEKLAAELQKQAAKIPKSLDILIQVNCSLEAQKSGMPLTGALEAIGRVAQFPNLNVKGLMTMAELTDDKEKVRQAFRRLRSLRDQAQGLLAAQGRGAMTHLSMGMSGDYDIAIEEGSTMVRIGRALFG